MNIAEKIKKHWFGGIISFAAICIGGTWLLSNELLVKPRDFEIQILNTRITELKQQIKDLKEIPAHVPNSDSPLVLEPTWVYGGKPIMVLSGQILITPEDLYIHSKAFTFSIKCPDKEPIKLKLRIGEMKTFVYDDQTYLFSLLDTDHSLALYGRKAKAKISIARKKQK